MATGKDTRRVALPASPALQDAAELLADSMVLIKLSIERCDDEPGGMAGEMLMIEWAADSAIRACDMIDAIPDERHMDALIQKRTIERGEGRP